MLSAAALLAPRLSPAAAGEADARRLFAALAVAIPKRPHEDALDHARAWLADPPISDDQLRGAADALRPLIARGFSAELDWESEADFLFEGLAQTGASAAGMPPAIARALAPLLGIPAGAQCHCMFSASAALAWQLSAAGEIRLYAPDIETARVVAILSIAAGRRLTVDRRNPVDGSFMPVAAQSWSGDRRMLQVEPADFILSVPPFGRRIVDETGRKSPPLEGVQIAHLLPSARRGLLTLVPDGVLFRESRAEVELRRRLVETASLTVASLPVGLWGRQTGISTSLLRIEPGRAATVSFVDFRTMKTRSVGRVQDRLVAQHLARWTALAEVEPRRRAEVPTEEVAANAFALIPDRYIRDERLVALDAAAVDAVAVRLEEVAAIERPKAPRPLVEDRAAAAFRCREIAPADIERGVVRRPRRLVLFDNAEAPRAKNVVVRGGDLVVSIKGNVGIVGQVPLEADLAESMGEPWIVSQSLAIVRLLPKGPIASADALAAILTAPWVRDRLERLSGGSVISTLPMSALRGLHIPVPPREELARADAEMAQIEEMRQDIARRTENLAERRRALWSQLWNVKIEVEMQDDA